MTNKGHGADGHGQQHGQGSGGAAHGHDPYLAHHFDTHEQQFESGKLGMWLFLATEVLLFGGLFCAYAVYRSNHPEIFTYAHQFLDKQLGGLNTLVLIFSSLTMAWAVRAAQLGERRKLITLLSITLACGFIFLGVKAVEYEHKWKHGLLWGKHYKSQVHEAHGAEAGAAVVESHAAAAPGHPAPAVAAAQPQTPAAVAPGSEKSLLPPAAEEPHGLAIPTDKVDTHGFGVVEPKNVQTFFGVYFVMTGLHGLHVIAGMVVIGIMLLGAIQGKFGPRFFTPVDNAGLYWHLVDLIWIYLFPLLYLIH